MAASLVHSMSRLCIHAPKVLHLLAPQRIKLNVSFQKYSAVRNHATLLNKIQNVLPAAEIRSSLTSRSHLHTTSVCATTYERKVWRETRVINRFYRLHWGAWIRCRGGRHKSLYKKTSKRAWELGQHIFCNRKQSELLDKLVTGTWREPKYFVDTPYDSYHKRTNCEYFPTPRKFYP